jgi:rhomboid protease GluP
MTKLARLEIYWLSRVLFLGMYWCLTICGNAPSCDMPTVVDSEPETHNHELEDDAWVKVGSFTSVDLAFEHSLVLLATGSGCRIQPDMELGNGYALETSPASEGAARYQLHAYEKESQPKKLAAVSQHEYGFGVVFLLLWLMILLWSYKVQITLPQWQEIGRNSSVELMEQGQWWRPFTSLFLHADIGHLLSNFVTGALFVGVLSRMWGAAKSWTAMLFCGALGNVFNSLIRYPEHAYSLGASTAVMAALGLLCAHGSICAFVERAHSRSLRQMIVPLAAGIALFGLTGNSSDPDVNVLGHACGFASGFFIGLPLANRAVRFEEREDF